MDEAIKDHVAWDDWEQWGGIMAKFFTDDMIYDTNYYDGTDVFMGNGTGIRSWYDREHIPINEAFDNQTFHQMIFAAERILLLPPPMLLLLGLKAHFLELMPQTRLCDIG